MSDRAIGFLAIAVWCGALIPLGTSYWVAVVAAVPALLAWWLRRPLILIGAMALVAATGSGAAWADLVHPDVRSFSGAVLLVADPEPTSGGVRVVAEIDGERFDLRAWGSAAGWLRPRLMGEVVTLDATLRPLDDAPGWLRAQGIVGRGTVRDVSGHDVGAVHTRVANSIRRTIESGAESMSRPHQALFAGLVYGDDRQQSALTADNFDAAGLTHLLAVSGQNVC